MDKENVENLLHGIEVNRIHGINSDPQEMPIVVCPICAWENVHMDGFMIEDMSGDFPTIVILMWCENGHKFEFCLCYHKGYTHSFTRNEGTYKHSDR